MHLSVQWLGNKPFTSLHYFMSRSVGLQTVSSKVPEWRSWVSHTRCCILVFRVHVKSSNSSCTVFVPHSDPFAWTLRQYLEESISQKATQNGVKGLLPSDTIILQPIWDVTVCWLITMTLIDFTALCSTLCFWAALHVDSGGVGRCTLSFQRSSKSSKPILKLPLCLTRLWRAVTVNLPFWCSCWWRMEVQWISHKGFTSHISFHQPHLRFQKKRV